MLNEGRRTAARRSRWRGTREWKTRRKGRETPGCDESGAIVSCGDGRFKRVWRNSSDVECHSES
jgi:hypothetical protein